MIPTNEKLLLSLTPPDRLDAFGALVDARKEEHISMSKFMLERMATIRPPLRVTEELVRDVISYLAPTIQDMLHVPGIRLPEVTYVPGHPCPLGYDPSSHTYVFNDAAMQLPLIMGTAHELTHAVVREQLPETAAPESLAFDEGLAIGIERACMELGDAFETPLQRHWLEGVRLRDLLNAYEACQRRRLPHPTNEMAGITGSDAYGSIMYGLGDAVFSLAEAKHGPTIYAKALRDPRVVLS